jgi:NitT/TauT family transport system substrate-binding protein
MSIDNDDKLSRQRAPRTAGTQLRVRRVDVLAAPFGVAAVLAARRAAAQALTPMRVGTVVTDTFAEVCYAQDLGFFQKAGLAVDLQLFSNGSAISTAIVGGALDVGVAVPLTIANAVIRGVPFTLIAAGAINTVKDPMIDLVVARDGPIHAAKDLEGKAVAVTGVKALQDVALDAWLDRNGADPAKVARVEMGFSAMPAAIERSTVAAAMLGEPVLSVAANAKTVRSLANPIAAIAPQTLVSAWYTTKSYLQDNAVTVEKFRAAIVDAGRWANQHHDNATAILAKYAKVAPESLRNMSVCRYTDRLAAADIQPLLDVSTKFGILPRAVSATELLVR